MARTAVSQKVAIDTTQASFIREMFERGRKLKAEYGERNVFDFSLGNPNASPPPEFFDAMKAVAAERKPALHRYMPNAGFDESRAAVAEFLCREYGVEFDAAGVVLTSGAAAAINLILRCICDPGDEVIVLAPYFPEYRFYIEQTAATMRIVQTDDQFQPDAAAIAAAITPRTRAIILNSPNNPSGAVYTQESLAAIAAVLSKHDRDDAPIYLICDDVYRRLIYSSGRCPNALKLYRRSIITSSYSKDLSVPGERLGYLAFPPQTPERPALLGAATMLNRTLGFVNAAAFMQRVIARCASAMCDTTLYRRNRETICDALRSCGYDLVEPQGALYAFPKTPIEDDLAFVDILLKHRILAVPGRGFGRPGHIRLSYCVDRETVEGALPGFRLAIEESLGAAVAV